jgi:hypothetical protein
MKAPAIPMRRSPTIPNPVPCTIWPASHPAMRPTTNMISRLSPDMCMFVSSSCISKLTNFRQLRRCEIHHQTGAAESEHSLLQGEGNHLPRLVKPHAKVKTVQNCSPQERLRIYPHAAAHRQNGKHLSPDLKLIVQNDIQLMRRGLLMPPCNARRVRRAPHMRPALSGTKHLPRRCLRHLTNK